MIELSKVGKIIDNDEILKDVSFCVKKGSIFGLIGPNGAGKTSLIKILTGIWENDTGTVRVKGEKVFENPRLKSVIGYVPDFCHYYSSYRVSEMLKYYKLVYPNFNQNRFMELNNVFKIPLSKRIGILSKGARMSLSLMLNLGIMPEILVMDEPTSGLDPIAKRRFVEIILDEVAQRNTTILISTHNLHDIEQICDTIAVINKGEISFFGPIEEIKKGMKKLQVIFGSHPSPAVLNAPEILKASNMGNLYTFILNNGNEKFMEKLNDAGAVEINEIDMSLEEIFVYSLGGERAYEGITG